MADLEQTLLDFLENPPETVDDLVARVSPDVYERLKEAVALGRWNEEQRMSKEQVKQCMQLVILYEAHNVELDERIGAPLNSECSSKELEPEPVTLMSSPQETKH